VADSLALAATRGSEHLPLEDCATSADTANALGVAQAASELASGLDMPQVALQRSRPREPVDSDPDSDTIMAEAIMMHDSQLCAIATCDPRPSKQARGAEPFVPEGPSSVA
jgi:hypothetical protein